MKMSIKQKETMQMIQELCIQFNENRWFTQNELIGVTLHTLNALETNRGMLESKMAGNGNRIRYYRMSPVAIEEYAIWV